MGSSRLKWFEFFLYTAIIVETALAAFVYKVIFRGAGLESLTISLTIVYFGFLAWAILQLNSLHRKRKLEPSAVPTPAAETPVQAGPAAQARILGLTPAQVFVVVLVFATAVVSFTRLLATMNAR
jgi:hypothetical protein